MERKPKELSGGERQRVALGRAIIRKPEVFLMDEPLSNLDAKLRVYMRAELKRLQKRLDTTLIYVTHDQVEAMTMSDRIAIMNEGKLQQVDNPEKYFRPTNEWVAGFMSMLNPDRHTIISGTYTGSLSAVFCAIACQTEIAKSGFYDHINRLANRLYGGIAELLHVTRLRL